MISHGTIFVKHLPMEEKIGVHFLLGFTTLQKEDILINTARSADEIKGK